MKRAALLCLILAIWALPVRAEEVGIHTRTAPGPDGTEHVRSVIFTGTAYIDCGSRVQEPRSGMDDTGQLWVDRAHRNAICYSVATQADGLGIFAYWDLNNQRAAYYRTLGQGTPVWESPGVYVWNYGGHDIGAGRSGEALCIGGTDKVATWSKLSANPIWTYNYPQPLRSAAKSSPDGRRIAAANLDRVYLFDAVTGDTLWTAAFNEGNRLQGIDLSSDGSIVAVTVYDSCFVYANGNRRAGIPIGTTSSGTQYAAKLSADGKYLVTGDFFGRVRLWRWNGADYDMAWSASIGNPWVTDVAISRDGSTIAAGTGYANGKAVLFDSASGTPLWTYQNYGTTGAQTSSCALSADGSRAVFASWGENSTSGSYYVLTVHDRANSEPIFGITRDQEIGSLFCCDISADGRFIAAGGKAVHAQQMGNGGEVYSLVVGIPPGHNVGISEVQSPSRFLRVGEPVLPQATAFNYGRFTESFNAWLRISRAGQTITEERVQITGLAPGSGTQVSGASFSPDTYGFHDFTFWTDLANDEYAGDDTLAVFARCFHDAYAGTIIMPPAEISVGYPFDPLVKVWNGGSYTDDISTNLTILDSAGNPLYSCGQTASSVGPGESAMVTMTGWQAPYAGRYLSYLTASATVDDFIPENDSIGKSLVGVWELMYDNGTAEAYYWVGRRDNDKFYLRFTPTVNPPFSVTGGRIWVNLANQPFAYVDLCKDDNGRPDTAMPLQRVENVMTPSAPAWITFDFNVTRSEPGDLWLVCNWPNSSPGLGIGADAEPPRDLRSYFSSNQDTFRLWTTHDWMMRITQRPDVSGLEAELAPARAVTGVYSVLPNPFRTGTAIRYSLAAESRASLKVFDPSGREVRTLVQGLAKPGAYRANWNGRDNLGRSLPAGVYFCHLSVSDPDRTFTRKLLLLR